MTSFFLCKVIYSSLHSFKFLLIWAVDNKAHSILLYSSHFGHLCVNFFCRTAHGCLTGCSNNNQVVIIKEKKD